MPRSPRGVGFLASDGGLTAVLGVVTVRIEAETIRDMIAARLERPGVPPEEKSQIRKHLNTVSAEALKTVTKRLVEEALAQSPGVIRLLHTVHAHVQGALPASIQASAQG